MAELLSFLLAKFILRSKTFGRIRIPFTAGHVNIRTCTVLFVND